MESRKRRINIVLGLILFAFSFSLFSYQYDFQIGMHSDEVRKADLIRYHLNEYKHPLYMRQVVKPVLFVLNVDMDNPQEIVQIGRLSSAFHGAISALFIFLIGLMFFKRWMAFGLSLLYSSSAIIAIHAHYFKEDIYVLCFLVISIYLLFQLMRKEKKWLWILLGLSIGLMISSHYKGAVFAVVIGFFCLYHFRRFKPMMAVTVIALAVFFLVNLPLFFEYNQFMADFTYEYDHMVEGHAFPITIDQTYGLFHIKKSLMPGFSPTVFLLMIGCIAFAYTIFKKREVQFLSALFLVYFLVIEISPLKPHPDFSRYAMPLVPGIVLCFGFALMKFLERWPLRQITFSFVPFILMIPCLIHTYRIEYYMEDDTRIAMAEEGWMEKKDSCYYELYSLPHQDWSYRTPLYRSDFDTLIAQGFRTAAISSFWTDRFFYGASLRNPDPKATALAEIYQAGIDCQIKKVEPIYQSYAFSNPTIYEVDLIKWRDLMTKRGISTLQRNPD
ncbi:phospholipid carrier-dependent glycosyltransferase [bacterium]|nr:phospholipid carrier-dependent glycosyltransferase [bacterium]